jgi:hypothetical protein
MCITPGHPEAHEIGGVEVSDTSMKLNCLRYVTETHRELCICCGKLTIEEALPNSNRDQLNRCQT